MCGVFFVAEGDWDWDWVGVVGRAVAMGDVRGAWGVKSKAKLEMSPPGDANRTERDLISVELDSDLVIFG